MPTVSINLSDNAYRLYREWKEERKGSDRVSAAIMMWNATVLEEKYTKEAEE